MGTLVGSTESFVDTFREPLVTTTVELGVTTEAATRDVACAVATSRALAGALGSPPAEVLVLVTVVAAAIDADLGWVLSPWAPT